MNYWIRRNQKKETDAILTFFRNYSPRISLDYIQTIQTRTEQSILVKYDNVDMFSVIRSYRKWNVVYLNSTYMLPEFGTEDFWLWLLTMTENFIAVETIFNS